MKKLIISIILLSLTVLAFASFDDFEENPANIGGREFGDIILPGFEFSGGFTNNHLQFSDLMMFEKDHVLTESEKDKLISADLNFAGYGKLNLLSFGYRNWEFSVNNHSMGYLGDIDKELFEIAFNGNTEDEYHQTVVSDSYFYNFVKGKLNWTYPMGLNLSFVPIFDIATKNSSEIVYGLEGILNYMREMNIYLGANINFYNANGYMEVMESSQTIISTPDSLHFTNNLQAVYTDPDITVNTGMNLGAGIGMKLELPHGWFHFGIDDLGVKMQYDDLVVNSYTNYFKDYLDYLDEDHEVIDESEEGEEEPYEGGVELELSPTIVWGAEYNVGRGFTLMAKYLQSDYVIDGFFMGTTYRPVQWLPFKLIYGSGDIDTYKFNFGFDTESFEVKFGMITYNGMFNGAKGYGTDFGIRIKF